MSIRDYMMRSCAGLLVLAFLSILIRWFTVVVLIDGCQWDNALTRQILWDNWRLPERIHPREKKIDWAALYPFEEPEPKRSLLDQKRLWENGLRAKQAQASLWSETYFPGYTGIVELGRRYDKLIGWDIVPMTAQKVYTLPDGWMIYPSWEFDVHEYVEEIAAFADFCKSEGAHFLFVPNPPALDEQADADIIGRLDFSLQKNEAMIQGLHSRGVAALDLYPLMHREFPDTPYHRLFFRTDHHWLPTTGFWAAGQIAKRLEKDYGMQMSEFPLRLENYRQKTYPSYFLGSQGKKKTTVFAEPDDFSLLYPEFPTWLHYEIPGLDVDTWGVFSVVYDMHELERKDFYGSNPYAAYNYADCSLIRIENFAPEAADTKILMVKDSFANSMTPFLALGVKHTDVIDLRYFKGSVRRYIKETHPDVVLVMHTIELLKPIERDSHQDDYDFR